MFYIRDIIYKAYIKQKEIDYENKKICFGITAAVLCFGIATNTFAANISYLPDVTAQMSSFNYWTNDNSVLMTTADIQNLNKTTVSQKGTNMYDLKNQADTVDGISLNDALLKSAKADAAYYMGWTYIESDTPTTEKDFEELINNTQNPNPKKEQVVLYAIVTERCELRAFLSSKAIGDDPKDKDFDYQYLSSLRVNEPLVITSVSAD